MMNYGMGRSDAAFRMMNTAESQLSSIRNVGPDANFKALAEADKRNALNMAQDEFTYQVMDKMEEQADKLRKEKIKESFSYFQD